MIFTRRQCRRLAWLALSAIVLTAVAPVISRVLMPSASMSVMPGMMAHHGDAARHDADHGDAHGGPLDACGYCSLFCHIPIHAAAVPPLQLAVLLPPMPPAGPAPFVQAAASILAPHPRGPPQAFA